MQHMPPGPRWLSFYLSSKRLLFDEIVARIADKSGILWDQAIIDRWFYAVLDDGNGPEVRWRIHCQNGESPGKPELSLIEESIVFREVAYLPEVERYGGPACLEVCERLFWLNSIACSNVLSGRHLQYGQRLGVAIALGDQLIRAFAASSGRHPTAVCAQLLQWAADFHGSRLGFGAREFGKVREQNAEKAREQLSETYKSGVRKVAKVLAEQYKWEFSRLLEATSGQQSVEWRRRGEDGNWMALRIFSSLFHMQNNRLQVRPLDELAVLERQGFA